jgi:hypothetical protein
MLQAASESLSKRSVGLSMNSYLRISSDMKLGKDV